MPANHLQRKYLRDRLNKASRQRSFSLWSEDEIRKRAPATVRRAYEQRSAAEKIVREYERKQEAVVAKRRKELNAAVTDVEKHILFSDVKVALAAVEAFERGK